MQRAHVGVQQDEPVKGRRRLKIRDGAGCDDSPLEYQGGAGDTTGPSGGSDAGGGSDTAGGLAGGIGAARLPADKRDGEKLRRERYGADEGKLSQRDGNIKDDESVI